MLAAILDDQLHVDIDPGNANGPDERSDRDSTTIAANAPLRPINKWLRPSQSTGDPLLTQSRGVRPRLYERVN